VLRHPDVVPLQTGGEGTPLFCFAGGGGLAVGLLTLARHFGGRRPVYGLQAHGLEYRGIPDWSVQAAARRHVRHLRLLQPCGPYVLVGHSFGGLVAMEVARILVAAGEEVALLVLVDSFLSDSVTLDMLGAAIPSQRRDSPNTRLLLPAGTSGGARPMAASYRAALSRARILARLPFAGVVRFNGMRQYDVFYGQSRLLTRLYRPRPWPGRALIWLAKGRRDGDMWSALMPGDATIRLVDGDHDNILREPLVSQLAAEIEAALDGVVR
jgi:thioesterase domain-containing protein